MNKNHTLIWNKARGAYVVAGENARRNGKRKSLACAGVIAISALVAGSAAAAPEPQVTSFTNAGNISVGVTEPLETAVGITVTGDVETASSNRGTIAVLASGVEDDATATGIYVKKNVEAPVTNSGTITAEANAGADDAKAVGLRIKGDIEADVINSGTITAIAESGDEAAKAVGIEADELEKDAVLTNTGVIEAFAETTAGKKDVRDSGAYALRLEELDGTVINSGTLRATGSIFDLSRGADGESTGDERLFALYADEGKGSVINQAGGVIDGRVLLGEDNKHHDRKRSKGGIDLTNDGLLDIRSSDSFVSGDFTQSAGGMFKIQIVGASDSLQYGNLKVGGDATLANGTQLRVKGLPGQLEAEDRLRSVIRADSFVTEDLDATLASLRITDNILAVNFTAQSPEQCGRDEVLDLVAYNTGISTIVDAIKQYGLSSAEDLAGVLDQLILDPDGRGELTEFLYQLGTSASPEELANKVAQALPLVNGASARASLAAIGSANRIVQSRLEGVSGRSSGDAFAEDRHVWIKPFGTWTDQDKTSGAPGYDAETAGVVVGIDGLVTDNSRLGVAFSYSDTNVDSNTNPVRQRTDITSYQLALYGSYSIDESTDFNYIVGAGRHDNDSKRSVLGTVADASFDGSSFFAGMGVAHTYVLTEQTSLTPSVRLDYAKITLDSYTEDGGFGSQHVEEERTEELVLGLDGKITHKLNDKATFVANLGVGYDLINDRNDATASFVGGSNLVFTAKAGETDPWRVRAGLGIVGRVTETVELTARYDVEGRDGYTNQTASLKLRKSF